MKVNFCFYTNFLRSATKTNAYLDPIINVCKKNGFDYHIFMEKKIPCGYDSQHISSYFFLKLGSIWFYKLCRLFNRKSPAWKFYYRFGCLMRPFFAQKYTADVIITIGGTLAEELAGICPDCRVVDIQHGVIYSRHMGYFNKDGCIGDMHRAFRNREFWLYGPGYAECFFKHPDNECIRNRVKIIGDVVRANELSMTSKLTSHSQITHNQIIIASQITPDFDQKKLYVLKRMYEEVIEEVIHINSSITNYNSYKPLVVVFRPHPRAGNVIDFNDWKVKYPDLQWDSRPFNEAFLEALCVVTVHSTVAFDAAALGIPAVFLDEKRMDWPNVMKGDFAYPEPQLTILKLFEMSVDDRKILSSCVRKWYEQFYTPFSEDKCNELLLKNGQN